MALRGHRDKGVCLILSRVWVFSQRAKTPDSACRRHWDMVFPMLFMSIQTLPTFLASSTHGWALGCGPSRGEDAGPSSERSKKAAGG